MRAIIFLSIFLAGCNNFPTIEPQERCFTLFDQETIIDGVQFYSGVCRCAMYEWTNSHIGKITPPVDKPLLYCDKNAGFSPDSTGAIYLWQENIRLWLQRNKKK